MRVPIEGVPESQILIGGCSAEFGRTSGVIVNAMTKSGTNNYHGSGFLFYTNEDLRAEDYFINQNNLDEPDVRKQGSGGAIGARCSGKRLTSLPTSSVLQSTRGKRSRFRLDPN